MSYNAYHGLDSHQRIDAISFTSGERRGDLSMLSEEGSGAESPFAVGAAKVRETSFFSGFGVSRRFGTVESAFVSGLGGAAGATRKTSCQSPRTLNPAHSTSPAPQTVDQVDKKRCYYFKCKTPFSSNAIMRRLQRHRCQTCCQYFCNAHKKKKNHGCPEHMLLQSSR